MRLGIVTGGSQGIGLGIVRALLAQRACEKVVVLDLQPKKLDEAEVYECDVTDDESVARVINSLKESPTVVVNNAGGGALSEPDPFAPVDRWRDLIDLNLTSAYIVTRHTGPRLERGATICNVASIGGLGASTTSFAYTTAKAALIHWTRSMAATLAPRGIRVNAVAPGLVFTPLVAQLGLTEKEMYDDVIRASVPLGTEQTPEDIGNCVAFLCSPSARQITGQVIAVDGGTSLGHRPPPRD